MFHLASDRRPILGFTIAAVVTTVLGGSLIASAAAASAGPLPGPIADSGEHRTGSEELLIPALLCPQQAAAKGFPLSAAPLAQAGSLRVSRGALPQGVRLQAGGFQLEGEPNTVETASFTLELATVRPDGHTDLTTKACTVIVKEAPKVTRVAGSDRYSQALAISRLTFRDDGADTVYLASGQKFADALSATAAAAHHVAPLLLTPGAALPAGVIDEIRRVGANDVVIVGGEASVSAAVAAQVAASTAAKVTRIAGADRYEVSRALIGHTTFGFASATAAFVATGATFADALTASPAAASGGSPVLLVDGSASSLGAPESALLTRLGVKAVAIVGGTSSVSASLASALEKTFATTRYSGATRYEVGATVNGASFPAASKVYLASGVVFADALSGGVAAGIGASPLYVTRAGCLAPEVHREIGRLAPSAVVILGGPASLSAAIETLEPCGAD
jgi:putative cell wall-binding protein